jgi:hypothetical protein
LKRTQIKPGNFPTFISQDDSNKKSQKEEKMGWGCLRGEGTEELDGIKSKSPSRSTKCLAFGHNPISRVGRGIRDRKENLCATFCIESCVIFGFVDSFPVFVAIRTEKIPMLCKIVPHCVNCDSVQDEGNPAKIEVDPLSGAAFRTPLI